MSPLQEIKYWLVMNLGLAKDALHIYVALIVFIAALALFRRRVGDLLPLGIVALAALAGEVWDLADQLRYASTLDWPASAHDLWNTLFWPAIITLVGRTTSLFEQPVSESV